MDRTIDLPSLVPLAMLRCPICCGELERVDGLHCATCDGRFNVIGTAPILLARPYEDYAGHDPEFERCFADARWVPFGEYAVGHWREFLSYEANAGSTVNLLRMQKEYDHKIYAVVRAFIDNQARRQPEFRLLNVGAGLGTFDNALTEEFKNLDVTSAELVREGPAKVNAVFGSDRLRHICADARG